MKHAALIQAALDGKFIQYRKIGRTQWSTFTDTRLAISNLASEYPSFEYRIKPKEDVVLYSVLVSKQGNWGITAELTCVGYANSNPENNVKITLDGETLKLKNIEVMK